MSTTNNIGSNSSFVSIRYASSKEALPDAKERAKTETIFINVAALRVISRLVKQIRRRMAAGGAVTAGDNHQSGRAGDQGDSTTLSSNRCENNNSEEKR